MSDDKVSNENHLAEGFVASIQTPASFHHCRGEKTALLDLLGSSFRSSATRLYGKSESLDARGRSVS